MMGFCVVAENVYGMLWVNKWRIITDHVGKKKMHEPDLTTVAHAPSLLNKHLCVFSSLHSHFNKGGELERGGMCVYISIEFVELTNLILVSAFRFWWTPEWPFSHLGAFYSILKSYKKYVKSQKCFQIPLEMSQLQTLLRSGGWFCGHFPKNCRIKDLHKFASFFSAETKRKT